MPSPSSKQPTATAKKLKGKCDICRKKDGFWGHNLQQCQTCHVLVHELCYGLPETNTKDYNFICHACKAVGSLVEVNLPSIVGGAFFPGTNDDDDDGCGGRGNASSSTTDTTTTRHAWVGREWIQQSIRPTVCVLCSHDSGVHAMHPLLDVHGPEGRQLTWSGRHSNKNTTTSKEGTKQLAWVHTLCASMICSNANTMGCVYGCDTNGNFYYDDDDASGKSEEEEDEDEWKDDSFESKNQKSSSTVVATIGDGKEMDFTSSAHRVRITSINNNNNNHNTPNDDVIISTAYYAIATTGIYARTIADHRKLKCFICGRIDTQWRIPLSSRQAPTQRERFFQEVSLLVCPLTDGLSTRQPSATWKLM
jgi:hypothetical protein